MCWEDILIFKQELVLSSWEAQAVKEHAACMTCCSHVTSICNLKSFLMWMPFALYFMLFPYVCWLHCCRMFCIGSCSRKNLRHVVWLRVFIFPPSLFLWNAERNSICCKPQLFSWKWRDRRDKMSLFYTAPFLKPILYSFHWAWAAVLNPFTQQLLLNSCAWIACSLFLKVFPNNEKHFLRHFIVVHFKRPFSFLQINVDSKRSLRTRRPCSLGTFTM